MVKQCFLTAVFALISCSVFAEINFPEFEAEYKVYWHDFYAGDSIHRLTQSHSGLYRFENKVEPRLPIIPYSNWEVSDFRWEKRTIEPMRYWWHRVEPGKERLGQLEFNWKTQRGINTRRKDAKDFKIPIDGQDKMTYLLQLRHDLIAKRKNLYYEIIGDQKVDAYQFQRRGSEVLETPMGHIRTEKVEVITKGGERRSTLWFAPEHHYMLIKLQQVRKGKLMGRAEIINFHVKLPATN